MTDTEEKLVKLSSLKRIRNTMIRYNRTDGYIDFAGEYLIFYDSKPSTGGVYITTKSLDSWIAFMERANQSK